MSPLRRAPGHRRPRGRPALLVPRAALAAVLLLGGGAVCGSRGPERPNIVVILADDLGWGDVGHARPDSTYFETPHIDRLARQGVRFTQAYAAAANCAPSRAALLTGQYYPRQPVYTVGSGSPDPERETRLVPPPNRETLPLEKVTLAEALRSAGYHTAFLGKWHLGDPPEAGPEQQGFDLNVGGYATGRPDWPGGYEQPENNPFIDDCGASRTHLTDCLAERAVRFIESHRDGPFYLQLSHYAPHSPLAAPRSLIARYLRKEPPAGHLDRELTAVYAAVVRKLDSSVGRVLAALDRLELTRSTIVIFTSDNGGQGGYHADRGFPDLTSNAPLRGGKAMYYEGGLRVPLVIRWPGGGLSPGTRSEPVLGIDLYPTLLRAAGVDPPPDHPLDGVDLLPRLRDPAAAPPARALFWHFPGYLPIGRAWRTTPVSVVRRDRWKLMRFHEEERLELYDLAEDPGETTNLAPARPRQRAALEARLQEWLERMDAPMPRPRE